jgi:serine/threonine protein kinase
MTELTRSRERFKPGSLLLGRYEVVRAVGIGTIGEVLHVLDHQLDYQSIALKILHPHLLRDEKVFQRFQNEVLISRQLANEHIVRVYDLVSEADSQYLVVEYVPGCNLAEAMLGYDHQRLPLQDFLYIFQQILVAIVHAHQQNVVHRDLKPANILLDQNGTVKLTDFGLARSIESAHGLTRTGEIVGSPAYLAPEQFRSPSPAVSADIYSVGILAFELLTGSLPFSGESLLALARAHIAEPFPVERLSARGVPNWLTVLIASCCEKDPALRPSSTREILEKIEAALLKESTAKEREFSQTQIRSKIRKNQRDISLFTKRWRRAVVAVWVGCVFTVFNFVLFEPGSRKRMTAWAIQTEIQTDIDSAPIQRLIFGDYDPRDPEAIFKAVHRPDDGPILSLIQGGASPMIYFTDRPRETVLHRAIRTNARYLDHLLRGDYNYDLGNEAGETPLLLATRLGAQGVIGPLLNLGVDINKRDNQGNSPLLVAVATGQADSVIAILNSRTTQGETDWS